jgi:DNA-binding CsgD family transcriptional regulator/PAS domain-containing protein
VKTLETNYDLLVDLLYEGALDAQPWQKALPALRQSFDAQVVSLVLRPPSDVDGGVILNCVRPAPGQEPDEDALADPGDWEARAYREQFFALDPFVNLPQDKIVALEDILSDKDLMASDYYQHYLQPTGLFRILGVDTLEPGGMLARLRVSRRKTEPRFSKAERELLARITPHLRRAIQVYASLNRATSERDVYAGAVDQLSVATLILDEEGRLLNHNALAGAILDEADGLLLKDQHLHLEGRDLNKSLQEALSDVIRAQQDGATAVVRALRVRRSGERADLGLVIRPVPPSDRGRGQAIPSVAIFVSDPDLRESASQQILGELFGLTPAEANLAILLARGLSLTEASATQHISLHTSRAQLKSVFAKTGVSRQAELVRLVLKSVASLG